MKKSMRAIIILLILVAIIITVLLIILNSQRNEEASIFPINEIEEEDYKIQNGDIEKNRNRFYIVKSCIEKFYNAYQKVNSENLDINTKLFGEDYNLNKTTEKYAKEVLSMLDAEYINYANITADNISQKLGKQEKARIYVDRVYTKELENSEYICLAEGRIKNKNSDSEDFKIIVRLGKNNCFKVFLQDYMKDKHFEEFTADMDILPLVKAEISNEEFNTFNSKAISTKEYINDLFSHFRNMMTADGEKTYQLIEERYKNIRFSNLEEFLTYRKENYKNLSTSELYSYTQTNAGEYIQYICKDDIGNVYVFKETAPFQYTIMFDMYSIPTEEFTKEYNSSTDEEKLALNIKKFFMGIDEKNYGYSYSVLSESFKSNKYKTKQDFVNYAKENFFEENKLEYVQYEKQNNLYIYEIKVTDATGENTEQKAFNIIMKLNEGTDFEMSFGEKQ